jgi:hypothetical protein
LGGGVRLPATRTLAQELAAFFLGALPQLTDAAATLLDGSRRHLLATVTTGSVLVRRLRAARAGALGCRCPPLLQPRPPPPPARRRAGGAERAAARL